VKKSVLAASLVILMAVAAEAQISITYTRQTSNSRLTVRFSGGSFHSYGYGGASFTGIGYGGASYGYSSGVFGYGSYRSAVAPGVVAGMYHPYGGGTYFGYPGYTYYSGAARPIMDYSPAPPPRTGENLNSALLDQGRKRVRYGDYRGAVDDIRAAVVGDPAGGVSEAWFAVALVLAGDARNADKAMRAALGHGFKGRLDVQLRDRRETQRVTGALAKLAGESAAYTLSLLGQDEKLAALAEKDASLKPLLPPAPK
jgi:hypothetical protein